MGDLISRRAAIEAVCLNNYHDITLVNGKPYTRGYHDGVLAKENDCIENIMNLPSAQPYLQPTCNQLATDTISRQAAIDVIKAISNLDEKAKGGIILTLLLLDSAQPDNHEVACLLAELFGDTCACNFNDIDEWLPEKCEFIDSCPNPGGVTCWEQFLKHRVERKTDG